MNLNRENMKKIMLLIAFTALMMIMVMHYEAVFQVIGYILGLFKPFFLGGAIAFILNVIMKLVEDKLLGKFELKNKKGKSYKRACALILTLVFVVIVVITVLLVVVPQLVQTFATLAQRIEAVLPKMKQWLDELLETYPQIHETFNALNLDEIKLDWQSIVASLSEFFTWGAGNVVSSTIDIAVIAANSIFNFFVAFVFSLYILLQKEKLARQVRMLIKACFSQKAVDFVEHIAAISHITFTNFITGQCTEALILGGMFVVSMAILRMPYALLVGIVISVTALIPIFGAFIGCVFGFLLIVMENPLQALAFIVLFLILQQIEGNLVYPHVVGKSVGLPSIWVMVAVTVGASLMGILGMVLFIPICSIIYTLIREWTYHRLEKQQAS